jgi:hypothetical protein
MASKSKKPSTKFVQQALDEPEGATTFDTEHKRVPEGRRAGGMRRSFEYWYECLWGYNEGWNGNWRDERQVTKRQKIYIMDAVASQLELFTQRKERAKSLIRRIDGRICNGNGGLHMITMCLCQIAIKEDERCNRYYHPQARQDKNDPLFSKLVNEFGLDPQKMANSIQKLRSELSL